MNASSLAAAGLGANTVLVLLGCGIFGALEGSKGRLQIQEYSIAQTSLEQIFNGFAATQEEEQGPGGPDGAAGSDGRKRAGSAAKAADDGCCKCCEV